MLQNISRLPPGEREKEKEAILVADGDAKIRDLHPVNVLDRTQSYNSINSGSFQKGFSDSPRLFNRSGSDSEVWVKTDKHEGDKPLADYIDDAVLRERSFDASDEEAIRRSYQTMELLCNGNPANVKFVEIKLSSISMKSFFGIKSTTFFNFIIQCDL